MKLETLNVDDFMAEVIERMSFNLPKFNQFVNVNMSTPVLAQWDPLRIEQVITNLISNALRYGNNSEIKLISYIDGEHIVISVTDKGPGISEANQKLIFERFECEKENQASSGLGLGLFIANEIVKSHGGQLDLRSEPGAGSTFSVKLPPCQKIIH